MPFISSIRRNFEKPLPDSNVNKFKVSGGDSIITAGGYRIHMFTSVGDSELVIENIAKSSANMLELSTNQLDVEYLVIAGGGGAGGARGPCGIGGAGAGGYRTGFMTLQVGSTPTTVGSGGTGWSSVSAPAPGLGINSVLGSITSRGGGAPNGGNGPGRPGGSGGGSGYTSNTGGSGIRGQGFEGGGAATSPPVHGGSGGGGAGGRGQNGVPTAAGVGGPGLVSSITGTAVVRGGGGGAQSCGPSGALGGPGGGGRGHTSVPGSGTPGVTNTGGGAGAASNNTGGNGGPGVVIVRYPI